MGHSLRGTNLTISGSFSIQDGTEKANYILVSNEMGKTSWKDPNTYISAKPEGHYIGELFGGGVVVAVWKENGVEKCLIAGSENISYTGVVSMAGPNSSGSITAIYYGLSWSSVSVPSASYLGFGASNSSIIAAADPTSAAKKCIDYINPNLGTGVWDDWFLPSAEELRHLMNNSAIFNKVLESYARDSSRILMDEVYTSYYTLGGWPPGSPTNRVYNTDSVVLTDINLFRNGFTRYKKYEAQQYAEDPFGNPLYTNSLEIVPSSDNGFYLSSTVALGGSGCVAMSVQGAFVHSFYNGFNYYNYQDPRGIAFEDVVPALFAGKVRPFRIGDDTQTSIVFDADWAVLTYVFSGEDDLDTRTTMITPYRTDSQRGFGSNAYYSWAPAGINSPSTGPIAIDEPAEGIAANGTFSVLWHAGDNTGQGYETVLINMNAFKYYFPGQSEIEIDARAHWYVGTFDPPWASTTTVLGITQRQRIDRTPPVVLKVDLYKGGTASRNPIDPFQWTISGYSASYSVGSYGKVVNDVYPGNTIDGVVTSNQSSYPSGVRVARFKYNVVGKFGKIIID